MTSLRIQSGSTLQGAINIPGDKSITHRALILGALAKSGHTVFLQNWLQSLDCKSTLLALQAMGVQFKFTDRTSLQINSVGLYGLQKPAAMLYVGNSGTTMRLLTGILAAQQFNSTITGDASLCMRPMRRIIDPLTQMGAKIQAVDGDFAPLKITGGQTLRAINYVIPIASAQVKSAILLASLYTGGYSNITSPQICRDHTELMLQHIYEETQTANDKITLNIPGDLSSAAFFLVGASITPGADISLPNVGINPTRAGIIDILKEMGANIQLSNVRVLHEELRADIQVRGVAQLNATTLPQSMVANMIDDLPILCIAAAYAKGITVISGAKELRFKESDRLAMLAQGLTNLGIKVSVFEDGLAITGGVFSGGEVASGGDHRIAMAFAMAGLVAQQEVIVQDTDNIATSFPGFVEVAQQAGMLIYEELVCPI